MVRLTAQSLTLAARAWLRHARHARILHIFDRVVNLVAGSDVLSLVTPEIGNGPFNVVVPSIDFRQQIAPSDSLTIIPDAIHMGDLVIDVSSASLWNPYPDWLQLRLQQGRLRSYAPIIRTALQQHAPANSLAHMIVDLPKPTSRLEALVIDFARKHWDNVYQGACDLDRVGCAASAEQLVGLGSGLTPAGDDWLLGCALAAHLGLPSPEAAACMLNAIYLAASGTNVLSSRWLQAATEGACNENWHTFFACCLQSDSCDAYQAAVRIVEQGHSSGADALAGYLAVVEA